MDFVWIVIGIAVAALAIFLTVNKIDPRVYFTTKAGKGIASGILAALLFACVFGLAGCSGHYFNDASVFVGLDYTKQPSPMCKPGPDPHTTSNMGLRGNIWRSDDNDTEVNAKYTHHSCAFNEDAASYDAPYAVEIEHTFVKRRR